MSPLVYLRNRARTIGVQWLESLATRTGRKRAPEWWTAPSGQATEHPDLKGLWLLRGALDADDVAAVRALAHTALLPSASRGVHGELAAAERECDLMLSSLRKLPMGAANEVDAAEATAAALRRRDDLRVRAAQSAPLPPPLRTPHSWELFMFEPGRGMAPMRPHTGEPRSAPPAVQQQWLAGFEVFGSAPVDDWLCLARLAERMQHDGHDDAARGAARLRRLQAALPELLPVAIDPSAYCMFYQWQELERGVAVAAHIDASTPPADTVVTLSLGTGSHDSVRVGDVAMRVVAGDIYAISGRARWDVDHEVFCSTSDRLSLTIRFARPVSVASASEARR